MSYLFAPERHEADGVVLRSYEVGDGARLSEAVNESYDHLRPWMPWATPHQSLEDFERLVRQFRGRYLLAEDFAIAIFSADGRRLLGATGFHLREGTLSTGCAEMGLWIRQSEAGRGLGTKVLTSLLPWGFTAWPWLRLAWRCDLRNLASVRVAQKSGLRHEGILRGQAAHVGDGRRDTTCYGLTREDWLDRDRATATVVDG
jgi:RimJ/RimL family protein N-acetyltransferase